MNPLLIHNASLTSSVAKYNVEFERLASALSSVMRFDVMGESPLVNPNCRSV